MLKYFHLDSNQHGCRNCFLIIIIQTNFSLCLTEVTSQTCGYSIAISMAKVHTSSILYFHKAKRRNDTLDHNFFFYFICKGEV